MSSPISLVAGGTGWPNGYEIGFYARPTIFGNVSNQMVIAKEEIFGPVLAIIPYDDLEEITFNINNLSNFLWKKR